MTQLPEIEGMNDEQKARVINTLIAGWVLKQLIEKGFISGGNLTTGKGYKIWSEENCRVTAKFLGRDIMANLFYVGGFSKEEANKVAELAAYEGLIYNGIGVDPKFKSLKE